MGVTRLGNSKNILSNYELINKTKRMKNKRDMMIRIEVMEMRLNKLLPSLRALQSKSKKSSIQMNQILTKLSKLSMKRSSERSLRKLTLNFLKLKKMQPNSLKRKLSNGLRLPKKRKREEPDSIKERKLILTTQ